jgi:hypothetical protein
MSLFSALLEDALLAKRGQSIRFPQEIFLSFEARHGGNVSVSSRFLQMSSDADQSC